MCNSIGETHFLFSSQWYIPAGLKCPLHPVGFFPLCGLHLVLQAPSRAIGFCTWNVWKVGEIKGLKSLSQNCLIFVLYFNYQDILVLGLFFWYVFHRVMRWMSAFKLNFFRSTPYHNGKCFLGLFPETVWWQLRVWKFPRHHWGPASNPICNSCSLSFAQVCHMIYLAG